MKRRIAILISGRGSNMMALVTAARASHFPAEVAVVISNRPAAEGLGLARAAGVKTVAIDHRAFAAREAFDAAVEAALLADGVELVCHAGFMRIQSADFATRWLGRQLNIHPSLLPAFKGLNAQRQALQAGVRIAGCTVHFVTAEVDSGPIIAQAAVPVLPGDTVDTLSARILAAEHRLYPIAVALAATGRARLDAGAIALEASVNQDGCLLSPAAWGR